MKYAGTLLAVSDLPASRAFYETMLDQKVKFDFGENLQFESGISLQTGPSFAGMTGLEERAAAHHLGGELYFETEDFDSMMRKFEVQPNIHYLQKEIEHPWGQRVTRLFDPDGYLIEIGESMDSVAVRYLKQGWTVGKTAEKTQLPEEYVKKLTASTK